MGFCGRVTNRSGNRDAGVSTNSPCRDINDTTVSSLLSLSLSFACAACDFFFIPFFFPPRTSSRELVMVGSRWNCSFSREREEEARRWWFIVPSRDSLNWGGDFGIFFFSLSSREEKRNFKNFSYIFTPRWKSRGKLLRFFVTIDHHRIELTLRERSETKQGFIIVCSTDTIRR